MPRRPCNRRGHIMPAPPRSGATGSSAHVHAELLRRDVDPFPVGEAEARKSRRDVGDDVLCRDPRATLEPWAAEDADQPERAVAHGDEMEVTALAEGSHRGVLAVLRREQEVRAEGGVSSVVLLEDGFADDQEDAGHEGAIAAWSRRSRRSVVQAALSTERAGLPRAAEGENAASVRRRRTRSSRGRRRRGGSSPGMSDPRSDRGRARF